jgi:LysM repeat protein
VSDERLRTWLARLAAPTAFFLAATVLILLVQNGLRSDDPQATPTTVATAPTETASRTTTAAQGKKKKKRKRFYRVRAGDTLESIAARFDTEVETLLDLNPAIDDPLALQPGQRIRIS